MLPGVSKNKKNNRNFMLALMGDVILDDAGDERDKKRNDGVSLMEIGNP